MKTLLLPALLASLMLQVTPALATAPAGSSASASIDWSSLSIQFYDLSGGSDSPAFNWSYGEHGDVSSTALTVFPYDAQSDNKYASDLVSTLSTSAITTFAQSTSLRDSNTLAVSAASQPGTVPEMTPAIPGTENNASATASNSAYFTLTGFGVAVITLNWHLNVTGTASDMANSSWSAVNFNSNYSDGIYPRTYMYTNDSMSSSNFGDDSRSGTFRMSILNTTGNTTTGYISGHTSANSYSQNITTPVPEPETYTLMLAGLGLVGFTARRRAA